METKDKNGQFVNDLLRTEFHKSVVYPWSFLHPRLMPLFNRKFMAKFIKVRVLCPYRVPHSSHDACFSVMYVSFIRIVHCPLRLLRNGPALSS